MKFIHQDVEQVTRVAKHAIKQLSTASFAGSREIILKNKFRCGGSREEERAASDVLMRKQVHRPFFLSESANERLSVINGRVTGANLSSIFRPKLTINSAVFDSFR